MQQLKHIIFQNLLNEARILNQQKQWYYVCRDNEKWRTCAHDQNKCCFDMIDIGSSSRNISFQLISENDMGSFTDAKTIDPVRSSKLWWFLWVANYFWF